MRGIGRVYQAFQSGHLTDDDEVALIHGEADTEYRALSEAMVNIRATLARAEESGVITSAVRQRLESMAKALFYPERSYAELFSRAEDAGVPKTELRALSSFVATNRVDQKREDALLMLRAIRDCCAIGEPPEPPTFCFQHTEAWDQVVEWAEFQPPISGPPGGVNAESVAAEVRLAGEAGRAALANGFNRAVAEVLARRHRVAIDKREVAKLDRSIRQTVARLGDSDADAFAHWLTSHGLTQHSYWDLLERQAHVNWMRARYREEHHRFVIDEIRYAGQYARFAHRAEHKAQLLAEHGLETPSLEDVGLTQSGLLSWYFEKQPGGRAPANIDEFLVEAGLADVAALEREALRELLYTRLLCGKKPQHGDDQGSVQRRDSSS
jgi:hypothetical protein